MRMGTLGRIHGGFQEKRSSSVAATELSSDPESRAENWESGELGGDGAVNFQAGRGECCSMRFNFNIYCMNFSPYDSYVLRRLFFRHV